MRKFLTKTGNKKLLRKADENVGIHNEERMLRESNTQKTLRNSIFVFLQLFQPKQGNKTPKMQGVTNCERI